MVGINNDEKQELAMTESLSFEQDAEVNFATESYEEETGVSFEHETIAPGMAEAVEVAAGFAEAIEPLADMDSEFLSEESMQAAAPEIVKIVFNNETPVNDDIIKAAIEQAKAEKAAVVNDPVQVNTPAALQAEMPKKRGRTHGLPQFAVEHNKHQRNV